MPHNESTLALTSPDQHQFELIHLANPTGRWRVLLLPAMGISAKHYIPLARCLNTLGAEVYIHEWRGLGSSKLRASRNQDWGYRALLEDLDTNLEAIKEHSSSKKPLVIAGHSLGGQLSLLMQARHPDQLAGTVCIASGSPYWKTFPWPLRWFLWWVFISVPILARWVGYFPGQRVGFAGKEARSVMADWARSGLTGQYRPTGVKTDLDQALADVTTPILGLRMQRDWFVSPHSLKYLMKKCPKAWISETILGDSDVDGPANHYQFMKHPQGTARAISTWVEQNIEAK